MSWTSRAHSLASSLSGGLVVSPRCFVKCLNVGITFHGSRELHDLSTNMQTMSDQIETLGISTLLGIFSNVDKDCFRLDLLSSPLLSSPFLPPPLYLSLFVCVSDVCVFLSVISFCVSLI